MPPRTRRKPSPNSDDPVEVYLATACAAPPLKAKREALLTNRIRRGNQDTCELLDANFRLVVPIARRLANSSVHALELIQAGNEGLLCAAKTFHHAPAKRFPPYARKLIREAIEAHLASPASPP